MFGFSWSWKRAIGLSAAQSRVSREIGVPLSRAGRERKVGRIVIRFVGFVVGWTIVAIVLFCVLMFSVGENPNPRADHKAKTAHPAR